MTERNAARRATADRSSHRAAPLTLAIASAISMSMSMSMSMSACGDATEKVDSFVGTWEIQDGNAQATCGGLSPTAPLTGAQVKLTAGTDSALMADVRGCLLKFDVAGRVASARPGQMCKTTFPLMGSNIDVDLTVGAATFTIDGAMGTLSMTGTAKLAFLGDAACGYQATASAVKVVLPPPS